jgi:hypothetical protein
MVNGASRFTIDSFTIDNCGRLRRKIDKSLSISFRKRLTNEPTNQPTN